MSKKSFVIDRLKELFKLGNLELHIDSSIIEEQNENKILHSFISAILDGLVKFIESNDLFIEGKLYYEKDYYSPEICKIILMVDFGKMTYAMRSKLCDSLIDSVEESFKVSFNINDRRFNDLNQKFFIINK